MVLVTADTITFQLRKSKVRLFAQFLGPNLVLVDLNCDTSCIPLKLFN